MPDRVDTVQDVRDPHQEGVQGHVEHVELDCVGGGGEGDSTALRPGHV